MKKKWVGNRKKRFYSEMWGNAVWGGGSGENSVGLPLYDGPMMSVEYMWVAHG